MYPPLAPQPDDTSSAKKVVTDQNAKPATESAADAKTRKVYEDFKQRIESCKQYRRKLVANWTISIDYRRGKPFASQTDEDQVAVNLDWTLTKAKQAALFSQVPQVRIDLQGVPLKGVPWLTKFERKLNNHLVEAGIESAMDECLPDCINAAGIGAILVSYESLTEDRDISVGVPSADEVSGEMTSVPAPVDQRYVTARISPADLLWPLNFSASNFDRGPWIGHSGRVTWSEGVQRFKLKEADKQAILGEDRPLMDKLTHDVERDRSTADEMVGFEEIFYWEHLFNEGATSFSAIHHLVFVNGKDKPVIDEPWKGQKLSEGLLTGAQKFPIRVLTLAYITDETIPPSDSAIGRPQVNEINKARTQMIKQRERSLPVRWFDVNRIDPSIQQSLMRGTWQAMIPVQGDGARTIGEISKASMPSENFLFDKTAKADLMEEFGVRNHDLEEVEGDPNQNKSSFNTQEGRERAKVASFFVGIAEVLGGLMCLYEDPSGFGEGFDPAISKALDFSILADSTVLLDAGQKLARLNQFVNTYAKSGWVNIEPVLQEIATLTGLDPSIVIKAPNPKPPVEPNISLRLTGVEDMLNPLALAFLIKSGQAPPAELIEQAKALIQQAVVPPQGMQMSGQVQPQGGLPMLPEGPAGPPQGAQPGGPPAAPLPPPVAGTPPGAPLPPPHPPKMGEAHPNWTVLTSLDKRSEGNQK